MAPSAGAEGASEKRCWAGAEISGDGRLVGGGLGGGRRVGLRGRLVELGPVVPQRLFDGSGRAAPLPAAGSSVVDCAVAVAVRGGVLVARPARGGSATAVSPPQPMSSSQSVRIGSRTRRPSRRRRRRPPPCAGCATAAGSPPRDRWRARRRAAWLAVHCLPAFARTRPPPRRRRRGTTIRLMATKAGECEGRFPYRSYMVPAPRLRTKARPLITMVMLCPITRPDRHRIARLSAKFPVILAFGLKPERFVGQEGRIDAVLEPPAAEEADVLVQALASGIEAGGHVIAVLPQWFPPEGALRLAWRARCSTPTASPCTRRRCRRSPARCCARSPPASRRTCPSRRRARLAAARARGRAARLHVARVRVRPERAGAELRPAPRLARPQQRVRRLELARAVRAQAQRRRARRAAAGDRPPVADGRRAAQRRRRVGASDTVNRALGGLPVAEVEADAQRPAWWGTSKVVESVVFPVDVAGARRGPAGRARAVGLPLVPRADRPLAVPAVRPPRAPRAPSPRAAASISRAASAGRWRGRGSCPCPGPS